MTLWRPAEVGCSVALFTVVITRVYRKPGMSSVSRKKKFWLLIKKDLVAYKKDERSGGHQAYLN